MVVGQSAWNLTWKHRALVVASTVAELQPSFPDEILGITLEKFLQWDVFRTAT